MSPYIEEFYSLPWSRWVYIDLSGKPKRDKLVFKVDSTLLAPTIKPRKKFLEPPLNNAPLSKLIDV